jgi:hypothetical protein
LGRALNPCHLINSATARNATMASRKNRKKGKKASKKKLM